MEKDYLRQKSARLKRAPWKAGFPDSLNITVLWGTILRPGHKGVLLLHDCSLVLSQSTTMFLDYILPIAVLRHTTFMPIFDCRLHPLLCSPPPNPVLLQCHFPTTALFIAYLLNMMQSIWLFIPPP